LQLSRATETIQRRDFKHVLQADASSVCTSPACIEYAKSITANLSPNYTAIDPCERFDEYVCGGFAQTHDYRPEQTRVAPRTGMEDATRNILREIMEGVYDDKSITDGMNRSAHKENYEKLKTAYSACMDEGAITLAGIAPLRALLDAFETYYPAKQANPPLLSGRDELTNALVWLGKNSVSVLVSRDTRLGAMTRLTVIQGSSEPYP
jgi:endothelin-converting enzyme